MNGDFDAVNFLFIMKPRCVIDVFCFCVEHFYMVKVLFTDSICFFCVLLCSGDVSF